jgi:hypothetical protein
MIEVVMTLRHIWTVSMGLDVYGTFMDGSKDDVRATSEERVETRLKTPTSKFVSKYSISSRPFLHFMSSILSSSYYTIKLISILSRGLPMKLTPRNLDANKLKAQAFERDFPFNKTGPWP